MNSDKCEFYGTYLKSFHQSILNVEPGRYTMSVHFQVKPTRHALLSMIGKGYSVFSIHRGTHLGPVLNRAIVKPFHLISGEQSRLFNDGLKRTAVLEKSSNLFSNCTFSHKCDIREKGTWYCLKLRPFTLNETTNLVFKWEDKENTFRYFKFCWDYIQIEQT